MQPKIKYTSLRSSAKLIRRHSGDAGYDISASISKPIHLYPNKIELIPTGVTLQIPPGFVAMVCPRSGLAIKNGITVLNAPGIIDSSYEGEIKVILINHSKETFTINDGDRIAQLVLLQHYYILDTPLFDVDPFSPRGTKGFGSTGIN